MGGKLKYAVYSKAQLNHKIESMDSQEDIANMGHMGILRNA